MKWWRYVQDAAGTDQQREIAKKLGVDQSTISRWKQTGIPGKPENVSAFASAYNRPVLEAFIAAGFLTERDAKVQVTVPDIGQLSDSDLLAEVKRRMQKEVVGNAEHPAPMNPTGGSPVKRHLTAVESPNPTVDEPAVSEVTPTVSEYDDLQKRADRGEFDDAHDIAALDSDDSDEDR